MYHLYLNEELFCLATKITYEKDLIILNHYNNDILKQGFTKIYNVKIFVKNRDDLLSELLSDNMEVTYNSHTIFIKYQHIMKNLFSNLNFMIENKKRTWLFFNENEKFSWLRSCYFYNREHSYYNKKILLDGQFIQSKLDFLCEFSEQLLGVGGYFGSDLDGFEDCFSIYSVRYLHVIWSNFDMYNFDSKDIIIDILIDNNVSLCFT